MKKMILVSTENEDMHKYRYNAYVDILKRIEKSKFSIKKKDPAILLEHLSSLWKKGQISLRFTKNFNSFGIYYIPSVESKIALAQNDKGWDASLLKKQKKAFRTSKGARFILPLDNDDGEIVIFITDWSPFPGACAIAVHRDHPIIHGMAPQNDDDYFTGKYVRHPLTGDLLPVWVASWVKPEFGTGAVVVNPAHSKMDLEFAKKTGFPIRFVLSESTITSNPDTWPNPPVIKTGKTIKTGPYDGLEADEASKAFYSDLHNHGWAEEFTDYSIGALRIGTGNIIPEGNIVLDQSNRDFIHITDLEKYKMIKESDNSVLNVNCEFYPFVSDFTSVKQGENICLVIPTAEVKDTLPLCRMLYQDFHNNALKPDSVKLIQKTQITKDINGVENSALKISSLVSGPCDQVAVLKKQILERVLKFEKIHQKLYQSCCDIPISIENKKSKQILIIEEELINNNFQSAFNKLQAIQNEIYKVNSDDIHTHVDIADYFHLAYMINEYSCPVHLDLNKMRDQYFIN